MDIESLRQLGFTYVSIDMARGISITCWRGSERKTYSSRSTSSLDEAWADLMAQINKKPEPPPPSDDWDDLL